MYNDGDYKGLPLENAIKAIHEELEENRAFLQMTLLDPDPDNRPAEDLRIQRVLELASIMEDVLDTLLEDAEAEMSLAETMDEEPGSETGDNGWDYPLMDLTAEERRNKLLPCNPEDIDLEYKTHTLGEPDGGENIEQDWNMDSAGHEIETVEETMKKKSKKKNEKKKGIKSKKDKKKKGKKK